MYAVIFRAEINELDEGYLEIAKRLRNLAVSKYGCIDFISLTEGNKEISISYWKTKEEIEKWKKDPEHIQAQGLGKEKWYKSYTVQIAEVVLEHEWRT